MRNLCLSFVLLAGACLVGACAQSRPKTDGVSSETHFLRSCSSDSCGKGLTCVCGACTTACDANDACTALAKDAVCAAPVDGTRDEGRTCDVKCSAKADCAQLGDAYACNDGRCRMPASPSNPSMNDAGAKDDAGASCGTSGPGLVSCALESVAHFGSYVRRSRLIAARYRSVHPSPSKQRHSHCVRGAVDSKSPFRVIWQEQGMDSMVQGGLAGRAAERCPGRLQPSLR